MSDLEYRKNILDEHLKQEHKQSVLAGYFKEVIYGGIDGIVTTFAVVAGFSGAALSNETTTKVSFVMVLLFGLANLFADGLSMGLENFLSVRSAKALYKKARDQETKEVRVRPEREYSETVTIMLQKGFSKEQARHLADIYSTNEEYWVDFMMKHEHEMSDPRGDNPLLTAAATFLSFMFFGVIPLIPFMLKDNGSPMAAFEYSVMGTSMALFALGFMKWKVTRGKLLASVLEVVTVGGIAAVAAYYVGTFFTI